jgi:hypothetical protein
MVLSGNDFFSRICKNSAGAVPGHPARSWAFQKLIPPGMSPVSRQALAPVYLPIYT